MARSELFNQVLAEFRNAEENGHDIFSWSPHDATQDLIDYCPEFGGHETEDLIDTVTEVLEAHRNGELNA